RPGARDLAHHFLDEGAEGVAAWALSEPTAGGVPTLGARVLNGRLRHDVHPTDESGRRSQASSTSFRPGSDPAQRGLTPLFAPRSGVWMEWPSARGGETALSPERTKRLTMRGPDQKKAAPP